MRWVVLVLALAVILGGAELFTNGVEWLGEGLGLSEGVVGSILAAVGTALPETILPLIAVAVGHSAGKEIGVGAILGAPFMLTTLAMFALGITVLGFARTGRRPPELQADSSVPRLDLAFFLSMFSFALLAGLLHVKVFRWILAGALVVAYGFYVRAHLRAPGEKRLETEAVGEIRPLYLGFLAGPAWRRRSRERPPPPPLWASLVQTLVGLGVIVGGANLFVSVVTRLADQFHLPPLAFALLVAPVATELPEIFNASVIWARRGKDTLAVGNITGALVFQSTFPVIIGLTLTPWRLTHESLVAAIVALGGGAFLYLTLLVRGRLVARLLLLQGLLYAGFVAYVITRID